MKRNRGSEATVAGSGARLVWVLEDFIFTPERESERNRKREGERDRVCRERGKERSGNEKSICVMGQRQMESDNAK